MAAWELMCDVARATCCILDVKLAAENRCVEII